MLYIEYLFKDFLDSVIKTDVFVSGKKKFNPIFSCITPIITLVLWCRPIFSFFTFALDILKQYFVTLNDLL